MGEKHSEIQIYLIAVYQPKTHIRWTHLCYSIAVYYTMFNLSFLAGYEVLKHKHYLRHICKVKEGMYKYFAILKIKKKQNIDNFH